MARIYIEKTVLQWFRIPLWLNALCFFFFGITLLYINSHLVSDLNLDQTTCSQYKTKAILSYIPGVLGLILGALLMTFYLFLHKWSNEKHPYASITSSSTDNAFDHDDDDLSQLNLHQSQQSDDYIDEKQLSGSSNQHYDEFHSTNSINNTTTSSSSTTPRHHHHQQQQQQQQQRNPDITEVTREEILTWSRSLYFLIGIACCSVIYLLGIIWTAKIPEHICVKPDERMLALLFNAICFASMISIPVVIWIFVDPDNNFYMESLCCPGNRSWLWTAIPIIVILSPVYLPLTFGIVGYWFVYLPIRDGLRARNRRD